ncbi:ethanolamine ammonia-lyase heavy chain [Bradyrhizobium elkanii USDA 61]|jgi:hypothetical protein|nr:ethanolamine ammonia-lyase heavy chain [Bradyrhizobium elkanii USDA 61]
MRLARLIRISAIAATTWSWGRPELCRAQRRSRCRHPNWLTLKTIGSTYHSAQLVPSRPEPVWLAGAVMRHAEDPAGAISASPKRQTRFGALRKWRLRRKERREVARKLRGSERIRRDHLRFQHVCGERIILSTNARARRRRRAHNVRTDSDILTSSPNEQNCHRTFALTQNPKEHER